MPVSEGLARIEALYRPYHAQLKALLERARNRFAVAILLDCHSMPSNAAEVGGLDIVLGDRFGASAAAGVVDILEGSLRAAGYKVRRNKPFAGGFITEHYGAPSEGVHAVQIEIARGLYLDEGRIVRTPKWTALRDDLFAAMAALGREHGREFRADQLAAE